MQKKISIFKVNAPFIKYILKYGKIYILCELLFAFCAIPSNYLTIMAPKVFLDSTFEDHNFKKAILWITSMLIYNLIYSFLSSLIAKYRNYVYSYATLEVKKSLLYTLMKIDLSYYDEPSNHDKLSRAFSYSEQGGVEFLNCITSSLTYITSLATVTYVSYKYEWWILLLFVFINIVHFIIGIYTKKKNFKYQKERTLSARVLNYLNGIVLQKNTVAEIKISDSMNFFYNKINVAFKNYKKTEMKHEMHILLYQMIQSAPDYIFQIISYIYLGSQIIKDRITVGDYTLFFTMYTSISQIAGGVISCVSTIYQLNLNSQLIMDFYEDIDTYSETPKLQQTKKFTDPEIETIEFCDVCFRYPGQNCDVLHNISFKMHKGEKISIVGYNGAGKTTLIMLILMLYHPTSGNILINGISYKYYDLHNYRKFFGVVMQSFNIYSMSILENILLSDACSKEAQEIGEEALAKVGLLDKVQDYEDGILTPLTRAFYENGVELSIGEKQKLAIARMYAKDSQAYIMDEPSSSLDPLTEDELYRTIENMNNNKLTLIISHRLSSVMTSDRVMFLKKGSIMCFGNHYDIIKSCEEYNQLFNLQAKRYTKEKK